MRRTCPQSSCPRTTSARLQSRLIRNPKSQIPNPKSQIPTLLNRLGFWDLGFGVWDLTTDPNHDLSEITPVIHKLVRLRRLLERKGAIDDGADLVFGQEAIQGFEIGPRPDVDSGG